MGTTTEREEQLVLIAQSHPNELTANHAMRLLRKEYDKTYGWCEDCDGLVCKEKDCCINMKEVAIPKDASEQWFIDCIFRQAKIIDELRSRLTNTH